MDKPLTDIEMFEVWSTKESFLARMHQYFVDLIRVDEDTEEEYFTRMPTVTGLARYLGTNPNRLRNWDGDPEVLPEINFYLSVIDEQHELGIHRTVTGNIFFLKSQLGWVDKAEEKKTDALDKLGESLASITKGLTK